MIVDKCAQEGLRPLRFGRDYRIREDLREYGCEEQIKTHPLQATLAGYSDQEDRLRVRKKEVADLLDGKETVFADIGSAEASLSAEEEEELRAELGEFVPSLCPVSRTVANHLVCHRDT